MSQAAQFARVESFGLVASKQAKTKKKKTTVEGACGEAQRIEGFTEHIDDPEPADVVYGMDPMDLYEQIKSRFKAQNKELKKAGKKARQKDSLLMSAGVFSYPGDYDEGFLAWQADCLTYLKKEYGEKLKSVVVHLDESNPHLHFFLCDFDTLTVDRGLDPAKTDQRKQRVLKDGTHIGQIQAYKAFQDRFQDAVGVKYGHARKIGSRDRIHAPPKVVRAILADIAANKVEALELEKLRGKILTKQEALTEAGLSLLSLEKRFSEGLEKLTNFFKAEEARYTKFVEQGDLIQAERTRTRIERLREEFSSSPEIATTLEKRATKPAWFSPR